MKTPDVTLDPLAVRRWLYRAAWLLFALIEVLFIASAWAYPPLEQRLVWTATLLVIPAALFVVGGAKVGMRNDLAWSYRRRVEARRAFCIVLGSFISLVLFVLLLTSLWLTRHAGDLAQTAAAILPLAVVPLLMIVDWEEF